MQLSEKRNQSLPADLRSYILQLCLDEKLTASDTFKFIRQRNDDLKSQLDHKASDAERKNHYEDANTNPVTEVLYSNLHTTIEQSSSLLSTGSQLSMSECKRNAIETLKMQSKLDSYIGCYIDKSSRETFSPNEVKFTNRYIVASIQSKLLNFLESFIF